MDDLWLERQGQKSFERLEPILESTFSTFIQAHPPTWRSYKARLARIFPSLFELLFHLYGDQYDFFYHLEDLLKRITQSWIDRSLELKHLDAAREADPFWFQSNRMLGGVCYVDLFAGDLKNLRKKTPYFKELGLTYLHLMPHFRVPVKENDGGYAVSSYREVDPRLGTIQELADLARELRHEGISLVLDLIINHTSNDHQWALQALSGDPDFQDYYRMFPSREMPDAYEKNLREIFPDEHPGAFTFRKDIDRWVWTTFHTYQWDLNYANPLVFNSMVGEMLFLANLGVEVLRLDAVAFIWKEMGTSCENLPEAHILIQAFNAVARIAAPALLLKSEAIVHPDEVIKYIAASECQLSYNPLLMALLWSSLATREVGLLNLALRERQKLPDGCAWINYVRSHDDIGWTFSDESASRLGINGFDHRQFLNNYYTGRFPGSFACGLPFQENQKTGDARLSGTAASLAGLEKAIQEGFEQEEELSIRRILLMHGIILAASGIPLIYLGDEVGMLNDYSYRNDPAKAKDSRWVHRPVIDWEEMDRRTQPGTVEWRIFHSLCRLITLRKQNQVFSGSEMQVMDTGNQHVLGFVRSYGDQRVLVLANFSESPQVIAGNQLRLYGLSYHFIDLVSEHTIPTSDLELESYQLLYLEPVE